MNSCCDTWMLPLGCFSSHRLSLTAFWGYPSFYLEIQRNEIRDLGVQSFFSIRLSLLPLASFTLSDSISSFTEAHTHTAGPDLSLARMRQQILDGLKRQQIVRYLNCMELGGALEECSAPGVKIIWLSLDIQNLDNIKVLNIKNLDIKGGTVCGFT